jgi:large subunit ribosomal protein L18
VSLQKTNNKKIRIRAERRAYRVRNRQVSRGIKPRISVFKSLNHIYAQIIDDKAQSTLVSFSSLSLKKEAGDKKAIAQTVGLELGKKALEKGIKEVFFDRGNYLYHGRIKSLAHGLRESGLVF